ncbi:MAG: hypothetical protein RLO81_09175 [Fulvivirga sp.]|uniref:hypothetical protein n=1 Tax=Fulvivirga sp. TaxID=1931237 RepID=UPI0032EE2FC7
MKYYYLLPIVFLLVNCTQKKESSKETQLGDLGHDFSISDEAKEYFDKGLLLLHSFEYEDAREAFIDAKKADPEEVMVYWGEAMTHYKALWGLQDVDAGRAVMQELGATKEERLAKAENELEANFWKGIELLYGEGELSERNKNYVNHMADMYEANPGNQEIAAFYALGLIWADYDNNENLKKSSAVAASIIEENPTHPGALHYMIHANDDPEFAQVAINAANNYAEVAPDAAHALHMPSHIYVALGMWNEVVSSNIDSYQASLNRMERKNLDGNARGYHSYAWLHYGYLQQGNYDKAADMLKDMIGYHYDSTGSKSYLIMMQNQQRIESGQWPESLSPVNVDYSSLGLQEKSAMHFFRSLMAFDQKDAATIQLEIDTLYSHLEAAKLVVTEDGIALCSAGPTRYAPSQSGIDKTQAVLYQMEALVAQLENNDSKTEELLKKATAQESAGSYDSGPPFIAYPTFEQYGDWLLTKGRYEEAIVQFDISLKNRTNRAKALLGKKEALLRLQRIKEAQEVDEILNVFRMQEQVSSL